MECGVSSGGFIFPPSRSIRRVRDDLGGRSDTGAYKGREIALRPNENGIAGVVNSRCGRDFYSDLRDGNVRNNRDIAFVGSGDGVGRPPSQSLRRIENDGSGAGVARPHSQSLRRIENVGSDGARVGRPPSQSLRRIENDDSGAGVARHHSQSLRRIENYSGRSSNCGEWEGSGLGLIRNENCSSVFGGAVSCGNGADYPLPQPLRRAVDGGGL